MHLETFTSIVMPDAQRYARIKAAKSLREQKFWLRVMQSREKPAEMFDCTFDWENEEVFSGAC